MPDPRFAANRRSEEILQSFGINSYADYERTPPERKQQIIDALVAQGVSRPAETALQQTTGPSPAGLTPAATAPAQPQENIVLRFMRGAGEFGRTMGPALEEAATGQLRSTGGPQIGEATRRGVKSLVRTAKQAPAAFAGEPPEVVEALGREEPTIEPTPVRIHDAGPLPPMPREEPAPSAPAPSIDPDTLKLATILTAFGVNEPVEFEEDPDIAELREESAALYESLRGRDPVEISKSEKMVRVLGGLAAGAMRGLRGQPEGAVARVLAGAGAGGLGESAGIRKEIRLNEQAERDRQDELRLKEIQTDVRLSDLQTSRDRLALTRHQLQLQKAALATSELGPQAMMRAKLAEAQMRAANAKSVSEQLKVLRDMGAITSIETEINGVERVLQTLPPSARAPRAIAYQIVKGGLSPMLLQRAEMAITDQIDPVTGERQGDRLRVMEQMGNIEEAQNLRLNLLEGWIADEMTRRLYGTVGVDVTAEEQKEAYDLLNALPRYIIGLHNTEISAILGGAGGRQAPQAP